MKSFKTLKDASDRFFRSADRAVRTKPWAVCLAMHEYARNLSPSDPYIPFSKRECPTERLHAAAENLTGWLGRCEKMGHYPSPARARRDSDEVKLKTGKVYGALWKKLDFEELTVNAVSMLTERLKANGIDARTFRGRRAIDIGCGSGRFTHALKKLGSDSVVGVDYGKQGLRIAEDIKKKLGAKGVSFKHASVLKLPFRDGSFDFVFCNGVLHHTENMERGIREMARVCEPGGKIWLYLYGDGGIFWYARKRMPSIMKKIPEEYTIEVLDFIGMPTNRFIFCDNWYVPIERHSSDAEVRRILKDCGIREVFRLENGRPTDIGFKKEYGDEVSRIMWGDGDLRYILRKPGPRVG
jgi:ubiquinone/menaquinone biosynthesis C-methylase UbiE